MAPILPTIPLGHFTKNLTSISPFHQPARKALSISPARFHQKSHQPTPYKGVGVVEWEERWIDPADQRAAPME
jgi:hypothetical protein